VRQILPPPLPSAGGPDPVDLDEAYAAPLGVRVNMVSSVDGAASREGLSEGLSGPADKRVFSVLRGLADVVLVGAGTARAEGYRPVRPRPERRQRRVASGLSPVPPLAVVSAALTLDPTAELFTGAEARTLVLTCESAPAGRREALAEVADVVVCGQSTVDIRAGLDSLAERGLRRVLCEGGPTLLGTLLAAGRVDEVCLTVAPLLLAGTAPRIATGPPAVPASARLLHVLSEDDWLFLRYALAGSPAPAG